MPPKQIKLEADGPPGAGDWSPTQLGQAHLALRLTHKRASEIGDAKSHSRIPFLPDSSGGIRPLSMSIACIESITRPTSPTLWPSRRWREDGALQRS